MSVDGTAGGPMALPMLIESLLDPAAYPERPDEIRLIQTHISYVLIAGDYVYKIKKPVDFGFLDYSTLDKRKFFCEEEVRLNSRLCPAVYLGVVPIAAWGAGFQLDGKGEPSEYAVKMLRLPDDRMMNVLATRGEITPAMLGRVAEELAGFHERADAGPRVAAFGDIETIRTNTEENFSQTEHFVDIVLTRRRYEFIERYTRKFLAGAAAFLRHRVEAGRIRDGHGDLHLANICYTDEPLIYDCIEFNERFRCGDVASEVAFLAMDLDFHGHPELSKVFVDEYVGASGDGGLLELLDFYKCYRAFVRGKVRSFPLDEAEASYEQKRFNLDEARRYFDLAYRYAGGKERPRLVVMCGLSGTGKSYLADRLAERTGLVVIRSDVVRKRLAGLESTARQAARFEEGIYAKDATERTYHDMIDEAAMLVAAGYSVLLDASFVRRWQRKLACEMAGANDARFLLVECVAPEDEVRRRLVARAAEATAVSDATWDIYLEQKKKFEPPQEIDEAHRVSVDTSGGVDRCIERVLAKLGAASPNESKKAGVSDGAKG